MKRQVLVVVTFLFLAAAAGYCESGKDYKVGAGDVLEVTVEGQEELNRAVTVAPDGTIAFPLVGSLDVKGKTVAEINALIEGALKDGYIMYPQVNTSLKDAKNKVFYVYGEVKSPGSYQFGEDMTILKAICLAGGLTKYGSESNIRILRNSNDEKEYKTIKVNLKNITGGGEKDKDVTIETGDTIIVSD